MECSRPEVEHWNKIKSRDGDIEEMFEIRSVVGYANEEASKRIGYKQADDELWKVE